VNYYNEIASYCEARGLIGYVIEEAA